MSEELPTGALQKRMAGGVNKMKSMLPPNPFGATESEDFSALDGGGSTINVNVGGVGVAIDSQDAQRFAANAASGVANTYLQQRTYGMVGLNGASDNGAGGLTIAGMAPVELTQIDPNEASRVASGAASNFLQSRTGGIVALNSPGAEGGNMLHGLTIGGASAAELAAGNSDAQRVAAGAANNYLQNRTGGMVALSGADGSPGAAGLTLGGNAAGALTKGMDPITGAIATGAANMMLQQKSGGMVSLNSQGNITVRSNETVDRKLQEARAAATVAGTSITNAMGAAGIGGGTTAVSIGEGGDANPPPPGGFAGGAVFDVARGEFQARWERMVAEEERLRLQSLDVDRRERQLAMKTSKQAPNFPPFNLCCIRPMVHHDIAGCIPTARQTYIKACYGTFYATALLLIANMVMIIVNIATCGRDKLANNDDTTFLKHLILSIIYVVFGIVGAFVVWYHPVYSACGTGTSITYVMAYIGLFVGFAFTILQAVGPLGYGGAGFLYAFTTADRCGSNNFVMILPVSCLWAGLSVCMFAYGIHLRKYYIEDQASLDAAREQLKSQLR